MTQLEQILTLIAARVRGDGVIVPLDHEIDDFRKGFIEYAEEKRH